MVVLLFFIAAFISSCDDLNKPKKLAVDVADVTGDTLEIIGTITSNDELKEIGKTIEEMVEAEALAKASS